MIRKCKWCGLEREMNGKMEFCSKKCRNAWGYANSHGKLDKREQKDEPQKTVQTIVGQLTKVSTTADQCVRIQIDIPVERVKFDVIQFLNGRVVVGFIEGNENEKRNSGEKEKDEFLDE